MHKHCSKICVYTDSILTKSLKRKHPTLVISILQKRKQVTCPGLHSRTEIWSQAVWLQSLVLLIHTISYSSQHCTTASFIILKWLFSWNLSIKLLFQRWIFFVCFYVIIFWISSTKDKLSDVCLSQFTGYNIPVHSESDKLCANKAHTEWAKLIFWNNQL